jgi:hypothetical protein
MLYVFIKHGPFHGDEKWLSLDPKTNNALDADKHFWKDQ